MKNYQNNFLDKIKFFFKLSFKKKIKKIFTLLGIRFILYQTLYNFFKFIFKSKSPFIRSTLFDTLKFNSNLSIIETIHNEKFIVFNNDNIISKEMFVTGEFDLKKLRKSLNFLNKNYKINTLYDIGANIGVICIPAVNRGLVKKAYAVEPENKNFDLLKMNIAINNLQNKINTYNYALSDQDDKKIEMELAEDNSGDHRIKSMIKFNTHGEEKRKTTEVFTKKFDTLFKNINPKTDLIWIDTQGYEPIILSGAKDLINSRAPIVLEFWPYALKRIGSWELMLKIIAQFDKYIDLSQETIELQEISEKSLLKLQDGWGEEKKGSYSLYTDLLLLNN